MRAAAWFAVAAALAWSSWDDDTAKGLIAALGAAVAICAAFQAMGRWAERLEER